MAVYDLEEQDQIDDLKAWWTRYGGAITVGLVLGAAGDRRRCRAGAGGTASAPKMRRCSTRAVSEAARAKDAAEGEGRRRADHRPLRGHRLRAARRAAVREDALRRRGDRDGAKAQYAWVVEHAKEDELQADRALSPRAGAGRREAIRRSAGDARCEASGRPSTACSPTCAAMRWPRPDARPTRAPRTNRRSTKLDPKSPYRSYVQVKHDALGGIAKASGSAVPPAAGTPAAARQVRMQPAAEARCRSEECAWRGIRRSAEMTSTFCARSDCALVAAMMSAGCAKPVAVPVDVVDHVDSGAVLRMAHRAKQ